MAKIIAPFKIIGTLDDVNFYETALGNYARTKGKPGISKKQFKENPIYNKIKKHGNEFGSCAKKSRVFRILAKQFYDIAKEGSFAGRVNRLLFEIVEEDKFNEHGCRTLENGLKTVEGLNLLLNFEANITRPLNSICTKKISWNWNKLNLNIKAINPEKDIIWPNTEANVMHIQLAIANWNSENNSFETQYSNRITMNKENKKNPIQWTINTPIEKNIWLAFICISFTNQVRSKSKPVHKKFNTATIIGYNV